MGVEVLGNDVKLMMKRLWPVFIFLVMVSEVLAAPTIYFSDARRGRTDTYRRLIELFHEKEPGRSVVQMTPITAWSHTNAMVAGDVFIVSMYAYDQALRDPFFLKQLGEKGVRVVVDLEVTGPQHVPTLVSRRNHSQVHFMVGSPAIASIVKTYFPALSFTLVPEMEQLYYLKPAVEARLAHASVRPEERRILFVHQYTIEGVTYLHEFFRELDSQIHAKTQVILALHPHTDPRQVEMIMKEYGSRPDVQVFLSAREDVQVEALKRLYGSVPYMQTLFEDGENKTNEFIPLVDAVISHSSTLSDVAKLAGLPVMDGVSGPNLSQLGPFIDGLDPKTRVSRQEKMKVLGQEAAEAWFRVMKNPPGRACLESMLPKAQ